MKHLIKVLAVASISLVTFAQEKPASTNPPPSQISTSRATRFNRPALDLTPEQRSKVEEINRAYATNATPSFARLATIRREIEGMINDEKFNEAAVRAKAKEIGDLEADVAIARAARYAKLRAFLTPEQARRFNTAAPISRSFQPGLHETQPVQQVAPAK